ncbi:MAG: hypothetical protein ACQZ3M_06035 [cyanobacterium endosymbiont of Rhopalodia fuxianensis]
MVILILGVFLISLNTIIFGLAAALVREFRKKYLL